MGSRLEKGSNAVRKRIESHTFTHEEGEEYEASAFGGFGDYFRRKKIKLQNLDVELRSQAGDKPQIFRGVVAHVNGYTQPSLNDIHKLIVQHGGGFMQYLDGKTTVTHIIASSLTPKKAVEFKRYRIVKPAWVVESVKAGRLLPWDQFRVLDEGSGQRVIGFHDGKVVSEVSTQKRGYKDQTDTSWYTEQLKWTPNISGRNTCRGQVELPVGSDIVDDIDDTDELPASTQPPSHMAPEFVGDNPHNNLPMKPQDNTKFTSLSCQSALDNIEDESKPDHFADEIQKTEAQKTCSPGISGTSDLKLNQDSFSDAQKTHETKPNDDLEQELNNTKDVDADKINGKKCESNGPEKDEGNADTPAKRIKLTAEEHNRILLSDPRIWKSSVLNPEFLENYYRESRLHHLSTWKADLKSQLQAMAEEKSLSRKTRQMRDPRARRYIMHVDFDSFFAAVSLKKFPQYKDKPAVVAHSGGSASEIASCNYPARKFGITNGMWMRKAHELCPDVKVLPYDFPAYEEASRSFYEVIIATGGVVQSVSIDEALVDISALCFAEAGGSGISKNEDTICREQQTADKIAKKLRDEVKERTGCDVSVGIGGNILLAKLALRKAKPAGQFQIFPDRALDFIGPLEVTSLPGVAYSIGGKLEAMGIKIVADIRQFSKEKMMAILGPRTGERLWDYARGVDQKEVGDVEVRKSVSAEVNWGVRFYNQQQVDEFMLNISGELSRRLVRERVKGKQLSLKVMKRAADAPLDPPKHMGHGWCDTFNKSVLLGVATNSRDILAKESLSMLKSFAFSPGELRGIGVQMTRLEPLKASIGQAESSQKKLQFKFEEQRKRAENSADPEDDPIEDVTTPQKPKGAANKVMFGSPELNKDSTSRKPLNTRGSQFILPSQVDPTTLAELPQDIRDRLAQHTKADKKSAIAASFSKQNITSPHSTPKIFTALPAQSQIDLEMLNALPEDVRSEVLTFYNKSSYEAKVIERANTLLSPSRNRTSLRSNRSTASTVRRRGRPGKFDARSSANVTTLTQSNFITSRSRQGSPEATTTDTDGDEAMAPEGSGMDPDFLAALPEDIRREVLDEQRRKRLAETSGIQIATRRKLPSKQVAHEPIEHLLKLPPRPPKPSFTGRKLTMLPQLREAISEWAREFREEGPYKEDVNALCTYMHRVITEEGDMSKVVGAVKWLSWVVQEELVEERDACSKWEAALRDVKSFVQKSVQQRGLGRLHL
ncbi:uncharacterized protein PV09_03401 [Verruconis gallopava]|uniref:DNA repair protein REV1 n=1 Tax=Verruconis gallopava TaxID=253628 RepID=A0A0D2AG90_9PEZI|nr:uncharacterized protein PV09_03401 [Verruconis gallopava]KIW05520.1 hypothetical protein PV09_03401 [Verruconis gallopava]